MPVHGHPMRQLWYRPVDFFAINLVHMFTKHLKFLFVENYKNGLCNGMQNPIAFMAYNADKFALPGSYYLDTNSASPFCKSS